MATLTRQSVQQCIMASYGQYCISAQGDIVCNTTDDGNVDIQCQIVNTRFNSGFAGDRMRVDEVDNLRVWCQTHPGLENGVDWSFGFRGTDHAHPDSINVTLIDRTNLMFNFHIYLTA
ncbi:hypothetical protein [Shewanella nanhaiensis]|uniref:Uncharacterized protein n=1 Tax=Shewanella nanhaiensis TaxID=2864872 RepID=A0ABS7E9H1_9GAMM|nr:hypothetical protein [Shewanella nanhaiensis]MBW8186315.1 hypothetical protein [Shewanella nanhaiensis]